ncbi:ADP-ribosylglycohydrolase family protein [Bifidobacterium castoris]|uniref:ADP-ribosylglycohydrolase n=1 Tax=Bifidobacterium castoris TaxID=2306972 RepID=A0A430F5Q0_9BIFI|nr:ADP-ribosylglycohydrolase family protein [Bifidobacterium castoris]RSX46490.1 ADP-ribosylglycohydrolase [Bifidobacterium castoris]
MTMNDERKLRLLQGAVYGEAIGDALGSPCQGELRDTFRCADPVCAADGGFRDDTSMTLATLDSLLQRDGRVDPDDMRMRLRSWLFDGKYTPDGHAVDVDPTTYRALGGEAGPGGGLDNGDGSLMRCAPLAFFDADDDEVAAVSAINHRHPTVIGACVRLVRGLRALVDGRTPREAAAAAGLEDIWERPRDEIHADGYVSHTLSAAFWCLTTTDSYTDCVFTAVGLGAGCDTAAALAGMLAGVVYGFEDERDGDGRGIPGPWDDALRGWHVIAEVLCGGPLGLSDGRRTEGEPVVGSADACAAGLPEVTEALADAVRAAHLRGDEFSRRALLAGDPDERERLFAEAARWFASAARLGDAGAATDLGMLYLYRHVQASDADGAAYGCFAHAASLGDAEGACHLGDMRRDGCGCAQDLDEAFSCYERASHLASRTLDADDPHEGATVALIELRMAEAYEWRLADGGAHTPDVRARIAAQALACYRRAYAAAMTAVDGGLRMYLKEARLAQAGIEGMESQGGATRADAAEESCETGGETYGGCE